MYRRHLLLSFCTLTSLVAMAQFPHATFDQKGRFGYADDQGNMVINYQYEEARDFNDKGLAVVKKGGKYGMIDRTGKVVVKPSFTTLDPFVDGIARVQEGKRWGLLKDDGSFVVPTNTYTYISPFNKKGVAWVAAKLTQIKDSVTGGEFGLIKRSGELIAESKYKTILFKRFKQHVLNDFHSRKLSAYCPNDDQYIDNWEFYRITKINELVPADNDYFIYYDKATGGMPGLRTMTGKEIFTPTAGDQGDVSMPYNGYASYTRYTEKTQVLEQGYINVEDGSIISVQKKTGVTKSQYSESALYLSPFYDNVAFIAKISGKSLTNGYIINKQGTKITTNLTYYTLPSESMMSIVNANKQVAVVNTQKAKLDVDFGIYDDIDIFRGGYAPVHKTTGWGYIDKNAKLVVKPIYESVYQQLSHQTAVVKKNGKWGAINLQGQMVIPHQFLNIYVGDATSAIVQKDDSLVYVYNIAKKKLYDKSYKLVYHLGEKNGITEFMRNGLYLVRLTDGQQGEAIMIDKDNNPFIMYPFFSGYYEEAHKLIKENGGKPLSQHQAHLFALKHKVPSSLHNKLTEVIPAISWDY